MALWRLVLKPVELAEKVVAVVEKSQFLPAFGMEQTLFAGERRTRTARSLMEEVAGTEDAVRLKRTFASGTVAGIAVVEMESVEIAAGEAEIVVGTAPVVVEVLGIAPVEAAGIAPVEVEVAGIAPVEAEVAGIAPVGVAGTAPVEVQGIAPIGDLLCGTEPAGVEVS